MSEPAPEALAPHDEESERVVLGEMLFAEDAGRYEEVKEVLGVLEPADFYITTHQDIFRAMARLHEDGRGLSGYALTKALDDAGLPKQIVTDLMLRLMEYSVTSANLKAAAEVVLAKSRNRKIIGLLDTAKRAASNGHGFGVEEQSALLSGLEALERLPSQRLRFRTVEEMKSEPTYKPVWFVRGLIGSGLVTLVGGAFKGGKSYIVSALMRCLETGAEFAEMPVLPSKVVVASEEGVSGLVDKGEKFGLVSPVFLSREEFDPGLTFAEYLDACMAEAERMGAWVIVIDTFRRFARLGTDKTKDDGAVQAVMDEALRVAGKGFAVVLLVHHRKGAQEVEDGEAIAGSYALGASADVIVEVRKFKEDKRSPYRVLSCMGRFDEIPKDDVVVELHEDIKPYYYTASGAVSELKATMLSSKALAFVDEWFAREKGPCPRQAILEGVKGKAEDVARTLSELTYKRVLGKCQKGRAHFFYRTGTWAVAEPYIPA